MNARILGKWQVLVSALVVMLAAQPARSANVLFVSDNPDPGTDNTFYPPLVGFPDDFYVIMLQNAGHNVRRFNPPNSQNTLLTAAQLAAINTNDLILVSRSINSGGFQTPQSSNWNVRVTKPLIMTSPYLVRLDGARLSWFTNGNGVLPDTTPPTRMRAMDLNDPETAFLFQDVAMNGNTMVDSFDEANEQNTSTIVNAPTAGGKQLATATFVPLAGGAAVTANIITEFPAGTVVGTNGHLLGGYRMFYAAGTREIGATTIPLGAGRDNLTPAGEKIFMRAIELALRNGAAPNEYGGPAGFKTDLSDMTVFEGAPVSISVTVTGALPRTVEWQRDTGDGLTFTNIPGSSVVIGKTEVFLPAATLADSGFSFQAIASNSFGMVTSAVAKLTVEPDVTPPTIIATRTKWTMTNIFITFSEPVEVSSATELFNYNVDNGLSLESVTLDATGTNLTITTTPQTPGTVYTVTVNYVLDRASTPNMIATDTLAVFTALAESRGFLISEIFTGIATPLTAGNDIPTVTGNAKYPNRPDRSAYVNVSSNAPTSPNLENYGGRLVGWLIPPVSGTYTLFIRGDDDTELRLDGVTIAGAVTANQPFSVGASQPQTLTGGQVYMIEALWREGTGGDYMQFAWTPPWSTGIEAITGGSLLTYAPGEGVSVSVTTQPQGSAIEENRRAILSVGASSTPAGLLQSYQWQKGDGAGGFTNALGGFHGATYTTPRLQYPDDDGSQWRVIVYVPGGGSVTSEVATVTVTDDVTPPVLLSAGSLDGLQVGVCFDEDLSFVEATEEFNYEVTPDGQLPADKSSVTLRPDGRSVIITLVPPGITGPFTLSVNGVADLSGNIAVGEVQSRVIGLAGAELGTNLRVGTNWTCEPDVFEIIAGGADFFGTIDTGRFASRNVTGDFDSKVRVRDLTLTAATGGALIAKAGLMVRANADTNSPTIWLLGNAPPPGRDLIESGYRATAGGSTVVWANNQTNIHIPDMWVRIARAGNTISHYASSNNVDWTFIASTNTPRNIFASSVLLGVAVTAHNNVAGLASTGRFSNFSVSQPVADLAISQSAPSAVYVGSNATYTITVANGGPDTANLVTVVNPIAAGSTHVSSSASQGSCFLASGVVTCNLGSIASGASATITLVTTMNSVGSKINTATLASSTTDPVSGNNSASVSVNVLAKPVISSPSYNGGAGTFSVTVPTATGFSYRLEYKDNLTDPSWTPILPATPGNDAPQTLSDPGPLPTTMRFYRIAVE